MTLPPYKQLQAACDRARAKYPEATKVLPIWTPSGEVECLAEVWHGDRAKVIRP